VAGPIRLGKSCLWLTVGGGISYNGIWHSAKPAQEEEPMGKMAGLMVLLLLGLAGCQTIGSAAGGGGSASGAGAAGGVSTIFRY